MQNILNQLDALKNSEVRQIIDQKMQEFKQVDDVFSELCFCLMTANFSALGGIKIQKEIGSGFRDLPEAELAAELKRLGHRFPNARASYICNARGVGVEDAIKSLKGKELRDWLVKNVKGLGMKEASHFLRNIGYEDFAIIDFHIVDLLVRESLIERPKTLTPKKYLEIETILYSIAKKANLNLGALDMYLWYLETGKILK
jgi:N-glycosylase/DNA lyase